MSRYSIHDFVAKTRQQDLQQGLFELERDRLLEVNLNGEVWIKTGAMVAYRGNVKFEREGLMSQGLGNLLKKAITGEGSRLTKASGQGKVYLADAGKKVTLLDLAGQTLFVNGNDVLALETAIKVDITMLRKMAAIISGGLFSVRLEGQGLVAITTHYDPLTLEVTPGNPVCTDPNATVAWSGSLSPQFKTDISLKTFFGRGSGESVQMLFEGNGFVIVQPYEELSLQRPASES